MKRSGESNPVAGRNDRRRFRPSENRVLRACRPYIYNKAPGLRHLSNSCTHTHSQQIPQQTLFQLNLWSVRGIIASWGKKNIENDKRRLGRMEEHRHAGLWNGGPNNLPSVVMIRIAGLSAYRQCEEARRSQLEIQTIGLNRRAAKLRSPSSSLLRCKPFLAWSLRDQRYNKVA